MRKCSKCKDKEARKGQSWCKSCNSEYTKTHRSEINATVKKRRQNPEYKQKEKDAAKNRRVANREQHLWKSAKDRAARLGLDFLISKEDIIIPKTCPLLGIPLTKDSMSRHDPSAPSLDRVNNSKGYIPGNVKVISYKANMMKSNASPEELEAFSENILFYLGLREVFIGKGWADQDPTRTILLELK